MKIQQNDSKEKYIFSRTRGEILFANYFDKYAFVILVVVAFIYAILNYPDSLKGAFFAVIVVVPFLILFSLHFKKAAYKLIIDLIDEKVEFYMFKGKGIIKKNIRDIEKVHSGGYLIFYFKGGDKILWKKRDNEEKLINILKKITTVK